MSNLLFAFAAQANTENTKRVLYTIFIIFIIFLAILSLIGGIIMRVTNYQGRLLDREISDPIRKCKIVREQKHFMKYATKKNKVLFFKQAAIPVLIIVVGIVTLLLYIIIGDNWGYNPWNMETGFGSLLITWDFSTIVQVNPGGAAGILVNWPQVSHAPTFDIHNWCGYIVCLCWLVGGLWYLYCVQGMMGRTLRILHLKKTMFDKSLENYNVNDDDIPLDQYKQQ